MVVLPEAGGDFPESHPLASINSTGFGPKARFREFKFGLNEAVVPFHRSNYTWK
jgi:hypothetical protein